MRSMSFSESRARYAEVLDLVVGDREEIVITRAGRKPVVLVALDEYESLQETVDLLRNPADDQRRPTGPNRMEAGAGEAHGLVDPEQ